MTNKDRSQLDSDPKSVRTDGCTIPCNCGGTIKRSGRAKLEMYYGEWQYMEEYACRECGESFYYWV